MKVKILKTHQRYFNACDKMVTFKAKEVVDLSKDKATVLVENKYAEYICEDKLINKSVDISSEPVKPKLQKKAKK